jgi:hypothetical protein
VRQVQGAERTQHFQNCGLPYGFVGTHWRQIRAAKSVLSAAPLSPMRAQVNTIISRVTGRDRAKFEAKFAKKSKAEDAYHEKKEYVQEL